MHYCSNLYAVRKMPNFMMIFSSIPFSFFFFFFLSHSSGRVLGPGRFLLFVYRVSRQFDYVSRNFDLVSQNFDLLSRNFEILSQNFEIYRK